MSHHAAASFWKRFSELPSDIQDLARENYSLLKADPQHPSLHFKRVGRYFSVRIGLSYRALGVATDDGIVWFWIGEHDEYERLFRSKP